MSKINPEHVKSVIKIINQGPFFMHIGMRITELDKGYSKVIASIGQKHMNPFGSLHGGVFSSVIDTAAYWSAYCDLQEDQGAVTIDLKIDLLSPVFDKEVIVIGKRIKSGKTLCLTEAQMLSENGKILAYGTSKLMITHKQTIDDAVDYISAEKLPNKFLRRAYDF
ncbi:thioesterase [Candidatus Magnetomorum sp. HK-1]|nr:thioesterase [Candidatus Magnetomorum sp. HK-1]